MANIREMLDKREIKEWLPIDWNSEGCCIVKSKYPGHFKYHDEYMGDHSEHFIIAYDEQGKEKTRYNIRDISFFTWA